MCPRMLSDIRVLRSFGKKFRNRYQTTGFYSVKHEEQIKLHPICTTLASRDPANDYVGYRRFVRHRTCN
jgi:hypothetical protein